METFSVLLALCVGNSPVTNEFPSQRPVTQSFDVFFDLCLNKRLSKQWRHRWFEKPSCWLWCHCNEDDCFIVTGNMEGCNNSRDCSLYQSLQYLNGFKCNLMATIIIAVLYAPQLLLSGPQLYWTLVIMWPSCTSKHPMHLSIIQCLLNINDFIQGPFCELNKHPRDHCNIKALSYKCNESQSWDGLIMLPLLVCNIHMKLIENKQTVLFCLSVKLSISTKVSTC